MGYSSNLAQQLLRDFILGLLLTNFHHGTDITSINRNQYFSTDMYFKVVVDNFDILILKVISTVDIWVIYPSTVGAQSSSQDYKHAMVEIILFTLGP